jgi:hypothetical protein
MEEEVVLVVEGAVEAEEEVGEAAAGVAATSLDLLMTRIRRSPDSARKQTRARLRITTAKLSEIRRWLGEVLQGEHKCSSLENDRERSNCQNNLHLGQCMLIFVLN